MDAATISEEMTKTRKQLGDIDKQRKELPEDAFDERATLMDEKHRLEVRLGELRALAERFGAGIAERRADAPTDLTHTPPAPRS